MIYMCVFVVKCVCVGVCAWVRACVFLIAGESSCSAEDV